MNRTTAIILAAGSGSRMISDLPKQFMELKGIPLVSYSIKTFSKIEEISAVVVVCHPDHVSRMGSLAEAMGEAARKVTCIVPGGATRQASSFIGIKNCPEGTETVLIHDAARPFADIKLIREVLVCGYEAGAAVPAVEPKDTIFEEREGFVSHMLSRQSLRCIQTPQVFRYEVISSAHREAMSSGSNDATDDCGLVFSLGGKVRIVPGSDSNFKITSKLDMYRAEKFLDKMSAH